MLNISQNKVNDDIVRENYSSLRTVESKRSGRVFLRLMISLFIVVLVCVFLPWTQNIRSGGNVTALNPSQRPQTINSVIAGRIEKWYVQEGDFVKRGDTILFISEVKDKFFDPNLLSRTEQQLKSKEMSASSYMQKVKALDNQIDALISTSSLKLKQARNKLAQARLKVISDSMGFEAAKTNVSIAKEQLNRWQKLYNQGLKSLTDLEVKKLKYQETTAYLISAENKLLGSRNELINAKVEIVSVRAQYNDDIAKAESDKYSAFSGLYDAEAQVTKLQSEFTSFEIRNGLYFIRAPQDGYITKAIQSGIGETIKEGAQIISIMPAQYDLAVEMYVRPIDLPLVHKGEKVRIQFDGWPAIVFSGWPNTSYGTYGGTVFAIDNFISDNGKYRVLVAPDTSDHKWPTGIRVGAGTNNMVLLKDVPIWYELWRQINGFPPDYYLPKNTNATTKKK
jgi:multidrug resistance efflux pump